MIELTNFTYKTNKVLFDGASFKAPSTGMIGIAGESGCGKTTFLKILWKPGCIIKKRPYHYATI